MTKQLPNRLVYDFLRVADDLASATGKGTFCDAPFRRAVSSAYYAVFHALCYVCADGLVKWTNTALVAKTYRALDHKTPLAKLVGPDARTIHPTIEKVGTMFKALQTKRHNADYTPPGGVLFTRKDVAELIGLARDAVPLIEALDKPARVRLAILLLVPSRGG